ncbi:MAG: hypothetical protein GAK34_02789 [Delftia tsuruhatensis]|nr:MAG: hypothetical protein GAK34_02789 [Delftia tsuruhatensis]
MDAEAVLMRAELRIGRIVHQAEPAAAVDQQAVAHAQLARHDVHHADLAAMAVEQQQPAHAGPRHAGAQFGPKRDHRGGRQRQRAGKRLVLHAEADVLRRKKEHGQVGRQQRQGRIDHALQQAGIDGQRQVRPMLLHGGHGQHRHGFRGKPRLGQREIARRYFGPPARWPGTEGRVWRRGAWHGHDLSPRPASHSTLKLDSLTMRFQRSLSDSISRANSSGVPRRGT